MLTWSRVLSFPYGIQGLETWRAWILLPGEAPFQRQEPLVPWGDVGALGGKREKGCWSPKN